MNSMSALVTGGSRGLGRGICLELARAGFSVAVNYRGNREAADHTVKSCQELAGSDETQAFYPVQGDVALRNDRDRMVDTVFERFGGLNLLVNNAGIAPPERADIAEASEESYDAVLDTNLKGPYFLTQLVAQRWLADGAVGGEHRPRAAGRAIVFVTSISAATVSLNRGEYCLSKAGLAMASQLWAARLAEIDVPVVEIRPGIMETDMTSGVKQKYDALIAEGLVPQRRWGTPEDIGRAVRSVAVGDFSFSTGAVMYADGGFHISRL
jgi:NAD(P)-dependent dehydrogenase (short-subunit alcohol dehydrogenase family)